MSRKRTTDQDSPENNPTTEPPPAEMQPASAETPAEGQTFAERVGQKQRPSAPDPFGIAEDLEAKVRLFECKRDEYNRYRPQIAIQFDEGRPEGKPSQAVIGVLKDAGFQWNPSRKFWAHRLWPDSAMSTRIEAESLYQVVRQMILHEKGIESSPEIPF